MNSRTLEIYETGEMDLLGGRDPTRQNGFAVWQIRYAWIDQAKWIRNYSRRYLFVLLAICHRYWERLSLEYILAETDPSPKF